MIRATLPAAAYSPDVNLDRTTNQHALTEPMTAAGYRALAERLARTPERELRVSGFSRRLARLEFLKWFPRLRRLSIVGLHYVTDLSALRYLPEDVEYLELGETQKPLDLAPALRFSRLTELRVVGHGRHLPELLDRNPELRALSLWRLPVDKVLRAVSLPRLESLALTLGSLHDPHWLTCHPHLRYLALRLVRGVRNLDALAHLPSLEWLWLDGLGGIDHIPDLTPNTNVLRVDLTSMRGLRTPEALAGVARAPRLRELLVSESRLPAEAFRALASLRQLERVGVGLGSDRRNQQVDAMLARPPQRALHEYAAEHGIVLVL